MIKVNISRENEKQVIEAKGSVQEMLTDLAVLLSGIYNQFQNADPATAAVFRQGVQGMVADPDSPCWKVLGDMTGIIFQTPEE